MIAIVCFDLSCLFKSKNIATLHVFDQSKLMFILFNLSTNKNNKIIALFEELLKPDKNVI